MRKSQINIFLVAGVVTLFLLSGCVSGIVSTSLSTTRNTSLQKNAVTNNDALITCSVGGIPHSQTMSYESGAYLKDLFSELVTANAQDPCSAETQQLQKQILLFAEQQGLLPMGMSADMVLAQLEKRSQKFVTQNIGNNLPLSAEGTGREMFCNFVATGEGAAFPIIILPRFIPIIMAPIPRLFVGWKTSEGFTSVGGLVSGTGFYAVGQQQGIALGFWGIGFSIFLPPVKVYGMFGYALFAKASAEHMEYYPPNNPPEITQTDPADGQQMVPTTLTELRFEINDLDNDLMTYNVTTEPNIGSGSGGLKPDGTYSIPISGLESLTNYSWYIQLTDGKDTVNKVCSFKTEPTTPILSNPLPPDGERDVPVDLSQLRFTLKDYQGDTMDYTVQTSPNIGSAQGTDVHDGTYTVPVSGMTYGATYRWYVNVTDGVHWTRKIFAFETGYLAQFNPFDYGWQYRKQITIDHTQVLEDLTNFSVLVKTNDADLSSKAQTDGGDIMFMNDIGVSTRIYHDLESYDASSGTLIVWVKIPFLSSTNDTVFYMYYGNPNCINQAYPEKTWDSNYEAVWHMKDNTTSTITESTSMNNEATKSAANKPSETTGKIGESQEYNGVSGANGDSAYITHNGNLNMANDGTISFWLYLDGDLADYQSLVLNNGGSNYQIFIQDNTLELGYYSSISGILDTNQAISTGAWIYITSVVDNGKISLYFNDMLKYNANFAFGTVSTQQVRIGNLQVMSKPLDGKLDEVRISNIQRTATWISTEYNNQNSPSTFLSIGLEESHP